MNLLLAYMATDPERLRAALAPHRERLRVPTTEAGEAVASCGLGFYQGGEILLQRRPRLVAQDETLVDLYDLLKDLRTDTLLGQVRGHAATRLAKNENTPPFRFRSFLFAHRGAPIRHLQHLAKGLAQRAKDDGDKHRNTLAWVVLESFDTTGDELDTHWQLSGIPGDGWRTLRLDEPRLDILARIEAIKPLLPRSALIRSLRSLAAGSGSADLELLKNAYASTHEALDDAGRATLARFWQAFEANWQAQPSEPPTADAAPLTALLTLWDYLLPPAPMPDTAEAQHA